MQLGRVLVVDPSRIMREVMRRVLYTRAAEVVQAAGLAEALARLEEDPEFDLVLCEVRLPDGDGFSVLGHVTRSAPGARVILMARRWSEEERVRAERDGAIAYLPKPVSLMEIGRVWALSLTRTARRAERLRVRGTARLADPENGWEPTLRWRVLNLSSTGAFLETQGPLPVGSPLCLELQVGARPIRLQARVARVQGPSWLYPGGVGVQFDEPDADTRSALELLLADVRSRQGVPGLGEDRHGVAARD